MDTKIRVMHLIHQLGAGGAENGIINLVNNSSTDKFTVSICAFQGGGTQTKRLSTESVDLFEFNKCSGNNIVFPLKLCGLFKAWKPHIVHTHAWGTFIEGLVGAKLAGVPCVVHGEHGTIQQKRRHILAQRFAWNFSDQILSVSNSHRDQLHRTVGYPLEKIRVITNGVDSKKFCFAESGKRIRESLGISSDSFVVGTIGRLVPVKNQALLMNAFAAIAMNKNNLILLVVGDGPLRATLESMANNIGISERVIFTGIRSDIPELLRTMDVFVLSSLNEGMPNTILEAMSSSLPVIATDVGGNSEVVKHKITGLITPSGNVDALAGALVYLIENEDKVKAFGTNGRKVINEAYDLPVMVKNYEEMYERIYKKSL